MQLHERLRPVDRLGHARRLQETPASERLHEARDLLGEARPRLRDPRVDDPHLLLEAGVLDVEVETAAAERIADLAAAVGSQYDVRTVDRLDRAELGNR